MPTYEYLCKECGDRLEVFQSFKARPLKTHEDCGGELQKVFHARGVVFKGSGFYKTDSRKSKASSNGAAATDTSKESSTAGATKSEGAKSDTVSDAADD